VPETVREARLVFTEELRRFTRSKGYIILTLAVPTILLALLVAIPTIRAIIKDEDEEPKPIGIVVLSSDLAFVPSDLQGFRSFSTRQEGTDALAEEAVNEVFVIAEDYLATGQVVWLHRTGFRSASVGPSDSSAAVVRAYLRIALASEDMEPELLARAVAGTDFERVRIDKDGLPVEQDVDAEVGRFIVSFGSTILLIVSIIIGASSLAQSVAEEKENRMIEVVLTSVAPLSLMVGKVLAIGVAELVRMTIWVASLIVISPRIIDVIRETSEIPLNPGIIAWVLAFFLAGYFVSAVIMAGIGAMANRVQEANQLAFLVIVPLVVPAQLIRPIFSDPDGTLARTLSLIPFTAPTTMMMRLAADGSSTPERLASLALIVLTGVVLLWASARVFRASLLMYGQRISLRRLAAALRQAG
jgi:ABC-2 type transport system permease protein